MRTLEDQIGTCRRMQWILAAGLLAVGLGFYLFAYRPMSGSLRDLTQRIHAKQRDLASKQAVARKLPVLRTEVMHLRSRVDRFDRQLPRQPDLGPFMAEIAGLGQRAALRKLDYHPLASRRLELFQEMPFHMELEGSFLNVASFLREIESQQRLTRVHNLKIQRKDPVAGPVEAEVTMNIYYAEGS